MMTGSSPLMSSNLVHVDLVASGADGVPDVGVADTVLARWLGDPHPNATSCLHAMSTGVV
jgi:hypothetical protein